MKVLFLIEGLSSPASRYRVLQFVEPLNALGVEPVIRPMHGASPPFWMGLPLVGSLYKALWRSRRWFQVGDAAAFDAVVVQRVTLPFSARVERRLFGINPRVVFDYDDAIFQTERGPHAGRRKVFEAITARAALVTAGSEYLAGHAGRPARVIPTVIDTDRYHPAAKADDKTLTIGWIGTASNYPNFPPVLAPLQAILERYPQVRLQMISNQPPPFSLPRMDYRPWSADREVADLQGFDIGLMPLADTSWNRGKCAFKLIQYMSVGIPTVAGAVGANCEVVLDGESGFLVQQPHEWEAALSRLIEDAALRRRLGAVGRDRCVAHYSVHRAVRDLHGVLRDAAAGVRETEPRP